MLSLNNLKRIKLNIWGGISARGATNFVCCRNNLNRFGYKEIILRYLYPFILDKYNGNCILHQDNDGKHNSALFRGILERYCINWNKTPPYSPNLKPIEEVWAVLKQELQDAVNQFIRRKLTPEQCQKYIRNLKKVYL